MKLYDLITEEEKYRKFHQMMRKLYSHSSDGPFEIPIKNGKFYMSKTRTGTIAFNAYVTTMTKDIVVEMLTIFRNMVYEKDETISFDDISPSFTIAVYINLKYGDSEISHVGFPTSNNYSTKTMIPLRSIFFNRTSDLSELNIRTLGKDDCLGDFQNGVRKEIKRARRVYEFVKEGEIESIPYRLPDNCRLTIHNNRASGGLTVNNETTIRDVIYVQIHVDAKDGENIKFTTYNELVDIFYKHDISFNCKLY